MKGHTPKYGSVHGSRRGRRTKRAKALMISGMTRLCTENGRSRLENTSGRAGCIYAASLPYSQAADLRDIVAGDAFDEIHRVGEVGRSSRHGMMISARNEYPLWRPRPPDFSIRTAERDDEIAHIAGPTDGRHGHPTPCERPLCASMPPTHAGARLLRDALYGTAQIPEMGGAPRQRYNKVRGVARDARARALWIRSAQLVQGRKACDRSR